MTALRRLAGQTAIYGIPGILGRIIGYLLVPLYTNLFLPGDYGTVNVFYSYASFLMVVLTYGMETAFFRFHQTEDDKEKVFSTGFISLLITTTLFLFLVSVYARPIAQFIDYAGYKKYVIWFGWILALDVISAIPFARLRAQNKPIRFASIKMTGIVMNILLNLFFLLLCPYLINHTHSETISRLIHFIYKPEWGIEYIFISNLVSSGIVFILLLPEIMKTKWEINRGLWKRMLIYAFPLLFAGMAGIVNETFDRLLLRYLLPENISSYQVGIYSACYKISILMTIFIQAYRYAAEPFFFAQSKEKNAPETYARIMDYFIITVSLIFLVTMVYLDDFVIRFVGRNYREGKGVIPVLMMANLFLGVYYNLSIWYKLTGKTIWGAWFSAIGAVITLILNFWWIPLSSDHLIHGYYGSAWATFICYGLMMILSYIIGQKYYPVNYNLRKFFIFSGLAVFLYAVTVLVKVNTSVLSFLFHTALILVYLTVIYFIEKPSLRILRF